MLTERSFVTSEPSWRVRPEREETEAKSNAIE